MQKQTLICLCVQIINHSQANLAAPLSLSSCFTLPNLLLQAHAATVSFGDAKTSEKRERQTNENKFININIQRLEKNKQGYNLVCRSSEQITFGKVTPEPRGIFLLPSLFRCLSLAP